ncbi:S41 family peptidase [Spongiivirga sp. MCCC 1A20706]|uniref:S41 family peptidase n=1 Tax=Spongiivirga sp. MCCC 1A20706 TaxID=3160963 RepID=UPI0039778E6D
MKNIIVLLFFLITQMVLCQGEQIKEPVKNFNKLWKVFDERYANFKLKNVDWNAIYKKYRPLINEQTTNDSLFTVCNQMLLELKDGHINLIQYGKNNKIINKGDDGSPSMFLQNFPLSKDNTPNIYQLLETTNNTLKSNGFLKLGVSQKGSMEYLMSKNYGYLRVLSMGNLSLSEYKKHADNAVKAFENLKGVIIDVRFNGGGDDKASFAIANRFADKKRIGHYKNERKKGTSEFKKLQTKYIEPAGEIQFTGPIIVLTSDLTASAAEVFTMIMKELPYVIVIGGKTNGIFSDMYNFRLPNGWLVTLSHQQYFSAAMNNYEGIGITPDIELLNKPEDIGNGIDPLIAESIKKLNKKSSRNDY